MTKETYAKDYFGTIIEVGDTVIYPASGNLLETVVVDIINSDKLKTKSSLGTRRTKYSYNVIVKNKTEELLKEKYPENFI